MTINEDLLYMHNLEAEYRDLTPSLKDEIHAWKFEFGYYFPSLGPCKVSDECYRSLDEFVEFMEPFHDQPVATNFSHVNSAWHIQDVLKCTEYVLYNIKYAQSEEVNQSVTVKEKIKTIEENLIFIRSFCMLQAKWCFWRRDSYMAPIFKDMCSLYREAASLFELFIVRKVDESKGEVSDRKVSDLLLKINNSQLQAEAAYFQMLRNSFICPLLTWLGKSKTLCGFVETLQKCLKEVSTCLHFRLISIEVILMELGFLRTILTSSATGNLQPGKLDVISTHIDVLAHEALSVAAFQAKILRVHGKQELSVQILDLVREIELTISLIRETNRDDFELDCAFDGMLFRFSSDHSAQDIMLELKFLQTLNRCTTRWGVEHLRLLSIRSYAKYVLHKIWWDLRSLSFQIFRSGSWEEELSRFPDLSGKLAVMRPYVIEVCTRIRSLKPLPAPSLMDMYPGLVGAHCELIRDLLACNPVSAEEMKFLMILHALTVELCVEGKSRTGVGPSLEDLVDWAACCFFLELVGDRNQTISLRKLGWINRQRISNMLILLIEAPMCELVHFQQQTDLKMLQLVNFMIDCLSKAVASEPPWEELIVLRCILTDSLKHCCDHEKLSHLLKDIEIAVCGTGIPFKYFHFLKYRETNIHLAELHENLKTTVRDASSKFAKLSPMLSRCELGFFDVLLARLIELKKDKAYSAASTTQQIGLLHDDLVFCSSFLQKAFKQNKLEEVTQLIMSQVISVGYKVENVIDTIGEVPDWFSDMRISDVVEEVKLIKKEVEECLDLTSDVSSSYLKVHKNVNLLRKEEKDAETVKLDFEDAERALRKKLISNSQQLEILAIVGMPGLGKTTLATKVYESVADSFHAHAWCYVSQEYNKKELLQDIFDQINGPDKEIRTLSVEDLAQKLHQSLLKKTGYLIILDDVWDLKAWNELKSCFPSVKGRKTILITSRCKSIFSGVSHNSTCFELNLLSEEKSWHLLEEKVFGSGCCPPQLHEVGMRIANKCEGLPLSVVVIAGLLKNVEKTEDKWRQVTISLDSLSGNQDSIFSKLELSYNHLSTYAKQCFLYCGAFFTGKTIARSKILLLWVAERFMQVSNQQWSLDDASEYCLKELVDRSLLILVKTGSDNRIRTCRIHDLMRDFCRKKADEENFIPIMTRWDYLSYRARRLCIQSCHKVLDEMRQTLYYAPKTRSLSVTACSCCSISQSYILDIIPKFRLLNVLDLQHDYCYVFPESVTEIISLRFLAIKGSKMKIPSSISKLVNLETLIAVDPFALYYGRGSVVTESIFQLNKLHHLQLPISHFEVSNENMGSLESLQRLSYTSLCSCEKCEGLIRRLPNLRKLKCLVSGCKRQRVDFPTLVSLSHLESLKVVGVLVVQSQCKLSLPLSLKKLSLRGIWLPWSDMETIAALPELEFLTLDNGAFKGQRWETSTDFRKLRYLRLRRLDIQEWVVSPDHFPGLEFLVVTECKQLQSIPSDFSDIDELKCIEIQGCCESVVSSAKDIENKQRYENGNKQFETVIRGIETNPFEEASE